MPVSPREALVAWGETELTIAFEEFLGQNPELLLVTTQKQLHLALGAAFTMGAAKGIALIETFLAKNKGEDV